MTEPPSAVVLNGTEVRLPATRTLAEVVAELTPTTSGIAVALNGEVAPRARWDAIVLRTGDVVDVVTAKQGG